MTERGRMAAAGNQGLNSRISSFKSRHHPSVKMSRGDRIRFPVSPACTDKKRVDNDDILWSCVVLKFRIGRIRSIADVRHQVRGDDHGTHRTSGAIVGLSSSASKGMAASGSIWDGEPDQSR